MTKAKRKLFNNPKFFVSPVKIGQKQITLKLPASLVQHLEIEKNVYWTVTNGVLQISGSQPQVTIPVLSLSEFTDERN